MERIDIQEIELPRQIVGKMFNIPREIVGKIFSFPREIVGKMFSNYDRRKRRRIR